MDTVEVQRWSDDHINIEIELTSPEDGSQWVIDIGATADGSWIDVAPAAGADSFDFAPGTASWDAWGGYEYGSGSTAQDTAWLDSLYGSYARWSHTGASGSAGYYGDWCFGDGYNAYGIFGADNIH